MSTIYRCQADCVPKSAPEAPTLHRFTEAVSDMRLRQEIPWIGRVIFDFYADLSDKRAQVFKFVPILRPPHRTEQFAVRYRLTGIRHQEMQQLKLFWREVNHPPFLLYEVACRIKSHIANHNHSSVLFGLLIAPDGRTNPRNQLAQLKWLGNVIICTCVQSLDLAVFASLHR